MKLSNSLKISLIAAAVSLSANVSANDIVKPVVKAGAEINKSAAESQKRIDKISDDIQERLQQFKTVNKEIEGLNVYNGQLQKQVDNQLAEMAELDASIDKVSVIERQIVPLMIRMVDGLEQFVALDVPFLADERAKRIADLKIMMSAADVATSEKFRRVLEAYQVEVDYGKTIEAYTGLLTINGVERDVEFLRIGRVALYYQTRDGQVNGSWDKDQAGFIELPSQYRIQISKGLRIARKQLAPDLLMLPLAAAQ
ncbi:DUF3450 domain-containing protein [Catenovulum sp. SM1970]|uniref:DUF3450 domain-containing protein n=1 Tax=Marinifaba aquimaris TaxID=2741323 RepID=UPI0015741F4F|nr:DUF3450 domain-containing protein [Marinifaba aquimaris]NTS78310.1 DUF3450 domain-containing protein [Marinifaba aquimaris]